jgi:hypothetical protein
VRRHVPDWCLGLRTATVAQPTTLLLLGRFGYESAYPVVALVEPLSELVGLSEQVGGYRKVAAHDTPILNDGTAFVASLEFVLKLV